MPAMTDAQKQALDTHAQNEPALQPRYAPRTPYLLGTELRRIGTTVAAIPDGSDLATTQTLANGMKAALVAAFGTD